MSKEANDEYLPSSITKKSETPISLPAQDGQVTVKAFVRELLPKMSNEDVVEEFQKTILIGHRKARFRPRKSLTKKTSTGAPPNRGMKRMTSAENRNCGLLRLKKENKTFHMFVPIHKMWKEYAEQALSAAHIFRTVSEGKAWPRSVAALQNKLKKLELFGSLLKVTKSRCSEYIGLEGIVIQETKNTFSIITTDDKVKLIPKLHSEFSFVYKNFGFSIFGSHLHQRPVDKAKQNFKKRSLWL